MPGLFTAAAEGLYATIGEIETRAEAVPLEIHLTAREPADLLCDFLAELLYLFETARVRLTDLHFVELSQTTLHAKTLRRPVDTDRSVFDREVKAVTRHDLHVEQDADGYATTIILDI